MLTLSYLPFPSHSPSQTQAASKRLTGQKFAKPKSSKEGLREMNTHRPGLCLCPPSPNDPLSLTTQKKNQKVRTISEIRNHADISYLISYHTRPEKVDVSRTQHRQLRERARWLCTDNRWWWYFCLMRTERCDASAILCIIFDFASKLRTLHHKRSFCCIFVFLNIRNVCSLLTYR